jgi:hypothetical protein
MAASLKISELNAVASLADGDLFLITDSSESTSKKLTVSALTSHLYAPLYTAMGAGVGTTTMGAFTGSILSDNYSVKQLLQELATAITAETTTRTSAIATVQSDVDQNETDADSAIAAEIAARTTAVTAETTARTTAIAAHNTRLVSLETDTTTKSYVDTQIASISDNAPDNLDTLNELAAALGDNPAIITTIQAELTTYKAHIEARNLQMGLAFGELYADTLTVG